MDIIEYCGKKLYQINYWKERKRYLFYRFRCWRRQKDINGLLSFFNANPLRTQLPWGNPSFVEQATRKFFYCGSTWEERIQLIEKHVEILECKLTPEALQQIYIDNKPITLWQEKYQNQMLKANLVFHAGQRKEGCLSLSLMLDDTWLYQIIFWIGGSVEEPRIYIGAIQGPVNGAEIIKNLTKAYYGYRTKNLVFWCLRCFAEELNCSDIWGVTNQGYYAQNGIRFDRKLKTDFGEFWSECEGTPASDSRFYAMPIQEHRKSMEELKPSKRAQHRKRFEKLDEIKQSIHESMNTLLK